MRKIRITLGAFVFECTPQQGTTDWLSYRDTCELARQLGRYAGDCLGMFMGEKSTREIEPRVFETSCDLTVRICGTREQGRALVADYVHPVATFEGRFDVVSDYR